ncbi:energy transducer TonB [Flavobacterium gelidilacus]|uniref:energy transducer TonB n=1 Tax=Flavobacterium gelidilacus TaxID=206041 RepID=UPI00041A1AF4|nr:energy transducer TonB [Flavobacterium gelidilacus]
MKNLLLKTSFLLLFLTNLSFAQENVPVADPESESELPFQVIEKIPEFEACEGLKPNESKSCFNKQIQRHIRTHLVYPKEAQDQNIQGRIYVSFVIDVDGTTTDITTRGPKIIGVNFLENEAIRIMKLLPKLKPGIHQGKPVKVKYTLPINFKLEAEKNPAKK